VLALHGWGGSHRTFEPLLPWLPADVTLIAPDLPGYGATPAVRQWTAEVVTEPLVELVRAQPGPVTLLGNCSGAILGLLTALRSPESFSRVVLIDPFARTPWYFRLFLVPGIGSFFFRATFQNPIGRRLGNTATARHRAEDTDMFASFAAIPTSTALGTLRVLDSIGDASHFASLDLPTDIVHGERTFGAIRAGLTQWQGQWPHARVHELAGAGHLPIVETPQALAAVAFSGFAAIGASG
jgi:pimeloyl-ACP methyl ester carboxylesterase